MARISSRQANGAAGGCSAVVESATASQRPAFPAAPDRCGLAGIASPTWAAAPILVMLIAAGALRRTATGKRQPGRIAGEKALVTQRKNGITGPGSGRNGD